MTRSEDLGACTESRYLAPASKPRTMRIIVAEHLYHCVWRARESVWEGTAFGGQEILGSGAEVARMTDGRILTGIRGSMHSGFMERLAMKFL